MCDQIEKGLIVKENWGKKILLGEKSMELRGSNTKIRGTIGIIYSKSGKVYGTVDIIDSVLLTDEDFYKSVDNHCVKCKREDIPYKKLYGWILDNPKIYDEPIPYKHKLGCVIWVNL